MSASSKAVRKCGLEIGKHSTTCDGCGRKIKRGERFITAIDSCCGGGCCRSLCADCVQAAARMLALTATEKQR